MTDRWRLVTCSYADYVPSMGLPVVTSIGSHPSFTAMPEVGALKPFGVFRVLDHLPMEDRVTAYRHRLHREQRPLERALDGLRDAYPGSTLVLLCWCSSALRDGCHRRWAADWLEDQYGLPVPEAGQDATGSLW